MIEQDNQTIADAYDDHRERENILELEEHLNHIQNTNLKADAFLKALSNNTTEVPQ